MFLYGSFQKPGKDDLLRLLAKAGAVIVESLDQLSGLKCLPSAVTVVADPLIQDSFEVGLAILKKWQPIVSSQWLLDSISAMQIQPKKLYCVL